MGAEPPIKGYTDEDAFCWCVDGIQACLPAADRGSVSGYISMAVED